MLTEINNSKEVIRNRMLKYALNYWNIKNAEDLDPIVKLILEALSNELYTLGNDIKDTQVRLLEKIAELLAPEFLTSAQPAHGILHASPVEDVELISEKIHFYTQKKISSKDDETLDKSIDIYFTPIGKVKLFNANVVYQVNGSSLYEYDTSFNKLLISQTSGAQLENNVLWLGLQIDENIADLNGLFFYFDWKNISTELSSLNHHLLPITEWQINGRTIQINWGIAYDENPENKEESNGLPVEQDLQYLLEQDTTNFYNSRYITITDDKLNNTEFFAQAYPKKFSSLFSEQDLSKLSTKTMWIKVTFPVSLPQESLNNLSVYTNSFPVINRQLTDLKYRLKGGSNIIPLRTTGVEQFLAVKSLADESHSYRCTPYRKMEEDETGTYSLRKGGVERFDNRNAKEFISYLLQLLRSESSAFSAFGNDFITSTLREMDQRIALMEQKTRMANNNAGLPYYIIAKPFEGNFMMYVEYYTTLANIANGFRAGSRMQEYNSGKTKSNSAFLLTTTTGGKNQLRPEERIAAFRYGLISRNRIVTKEDIRNLCYHELGQEIKKVSIEKGVEMSTNPKHGFRRTIDISITPSLPPNKLSQEDWAHRFELLKSKLQSRSGLNNHYRIFLTK